MDFSGKLKDLLNDRKWSKRQLAGEMGISPSTLSGYLSGKNTPNLVDFCEYAHKLGVSVEWLSGEDSLSMGALIKPGTTSYADIISIINQLLNNNDLRFDLSMRPGISGDIPISDELIIKTDNPILTSFYNTAKRLEGLLNENLITEEEFQEWTETQRLKHANTIVGSDTH